IVNCDDQKEMDYFWEKLSAVPAAEQCGWIKDKYGLSWQIVPAALEEMVNQGTPEQIDRIVQVMMPMKKLELATIQSAWHQESYKNIRHQGQLIATLDFSYFNCVCCGN